MILILLNQCFITECCASRGIAIFHRNEEFNNELQEDSEEEDSQA